MSIDFRDKQGVPVSVDAASTIMRTEGDEVSSETITVGADKVRIRTRWQPFSPRDDEHLFLTTVMGDSASDGMQEYKTHSLAEAILMHDSIAGRYRERAALLQDGGSPVLNDGVL